MTFALLGDIRIGDAAWTGPTRLQEARKATLVEHKVARGKPVLQDMGDELDGKTMEFFFDETFCEPMDEADKLAAAFAAREPLAYVGGDGAFAGVRFLVEDYGVDTLKTTPRGRPVRMRVQAKLKECPAANPLDVFSAIAAGAAVGLSPLASLSVEVSVSVQLGPVSLSAGVSASVRL